MSSKDKKNPGVQDKVKEKMKKAPAKSAKDKTAEEKTGMSNFGTTFTVMKTNLSQFKSKVSTLIGKKSEVAKTNVSDVSSISNISNISMDATGIKQNSGFDLKKKVMWAVGGLVAFVAAAFLMLPSFFSDDSVQTEEHVSEVVDQVNDEEPAKKKEEPQVKLPENSQPVQKLDAKTENKEQQPKKMQVTVKKKEKEKATAKKAVVKSKHKDKKQIANKNKKNKDQKKKVATNKKKQKDQKKVVANQHKQKKLTKPSH